MSSKNVHKLTFREFIDNAKSTNDPTIAFVEREIMAHMVNDGFTENDVYSLPMKRLWLLYLSIVEKGFQDSLDRMYKVAESNPSAINIEMLNKLRGYL